MKKLFKKDSRMVGILLWLIRGALFLFLLIRLLFVARDVSIPLLDDAIILTRRQTLIWETIFLNASAIPLFFALYEYNPPALRRAVREAQKVPDYRESLAQTIKSTEFLTALLWLIPPVLLGAADPAAALMLGDSAPKLLRMGLGFALWALPMALICWLGCGVIRRSWVRHFLSQEAEGRAAILAGERTRGGYSVVRLTVNLAAICAGISILSMVLMAAYTPIRVAGLLLWTFKFRLLALILLVCAVRRFHHLRFRRKFEARMREICAQPGCAFTVIRKRGRWRLKFSGEEEYRLEIDGHILHLCLLRIAHRFSRVYFDTRGGYRYRLHFMQFNPFLPRHRLDTAGIGDGRGERMLLLTKEPGVWLYGDTDAERYGKLYNGARIYGCTLYIADDFCRFADRKAREKSLRNEF